MVLFNAMIIVFISQVFINLIKVDYNKYNETTSNNMTKEEVIKKILSNDYFGEKILTHMKDFSISIDDLLNDDGAPELIKKLLNVK